MAALSRTLGMIQAKEDEQNLETATARTGSGLDAEAWAQAWREGQEMSLEEAVAYALGEAI